jgi:glycosyltransferase involved in cell wall biosynthesis
VKENTSVFDAILCSQADWDALEVIQAADRRHIPVFVRVDPSPLGGNGLEFERWGLRSAPAIRACRSASMVLVTSQTAHQQILAQGIPPEKIVRLPVWRPPPVDYSRRARELARRALRDVNYELTTDGRSRVLLVPGDMTAAWGVDFLIDSIWQLLDDHSHLKVWLHGDGPMKDKVYHKLKSYGVHRSVVMPGVFSSMEPLLQAVDGCLFPKAGCGMSWLLPTCIASGIPVLAARTQELVSGWGPSAQSLTFAPDSSEDLRNGLENFWENFDSWIKATREVSRYVRLQTCESDLRPRLHDAKGQTLPDALWDLVQRGNDSMRLAE